jgi:hypothetical protein
MFDYHVRFCLITPEPPSPSPLDRLNAFSRPWIIKQCMLDRAADIYINASDADDDDKASARRRD